MANSIIPETPDETWVLGRPWARRASRGALVLLAISAYCLLRASPAFTTVAVTFVVVGLVAVILRFTERPRRIREVRSTRQIPIIR
jgi:hypothetical protein